MTSGPTVVISADAAAVAAATAERFTGSSWRPGSRGTASVVLTGGGIGTATLRALAAGRGRTASTGGPSTSGGATSGSCRGDPRPQRHPGPRRRCSTRSTLDWSRVHAMGAPDGPDGDDLDAAAARYAAELAAAALGRRRCRRSTCCMLGVGPRGTSRRSSQSRRRRRRAGRDRRARLPRSRRRHGCRCLSLRSTRPRGLVDDGRRRRRPARSALALGGAGEVGYRLLAPAVGNARCGCSTRPPPSSAARGSGLSQPPRAERPWSATRMMPGFRHERGARDPGRRSWRAGARAPRSGWPRRRRRCDALARRPGGSCTARSGRRRRCVAVGAGREATARAVPRLRDRRVGRERRPGLVIVGAPERDAAPRRGLAALGLAHRSSADPTTANRVATSHVVSPSVLPERCCGLECTGRKFGAYAPVKCDLGRRPGYGVT